MSNWQPIETAPTNGVNILGWSKELGPVVCQYGMTEVDDDQVEEGWLLWQDFGNWVIKPTHWIPIPKYPTV